MVAKYVINSSGAKASGGVLFAGNMIHYTKLEVVKYGFLIAIKFSNQEKMNKLFSSSEINTGRQAFLDTAKVIAIVFMVHIHLIKYATDFLNPSHFVFAGITGYFTGGVFAAPVFMFCMGIGMVYSRRSEPRLMVERGIDLYIKAWALNILRAGLLCFIIWLITQDQDFLDYALFYTTFIDILQFAALAFFLMALLYKLKLNVMAIFGVAIALAVFGTYFRYIDMGNYALNVFLGQFIGIVGENFETAFPLCHWFIFVAGGLLFGQALRRCRDRKKLLLRLLVPSIIVFVVYNLVNIREMSGIYADTFAYYYMTVIDMVYAFSAVFIMLCFSFFITWLLPEKVLSIIEKASKNITAIYCIHWVIILNVFGIVFNYLLEYKLNMVTLHIATVLVVIASVLLAEKLPEKLR